MLSFKQQKKIVSSLKLIFLFSIVVSLIGCGTLTGIPSHGGGKRFAIEQRLVSATARGAIKEIDLSVLRGKTVFLQITSINDQGGGNLIGGRASALFALQGISESSPIVTQNSVFKIFDLTGNLTSSGRQNTSGSSNSTGSNRSSNSNGGGTTTVTTGSNNGTSSSTNNGGGTNTNTTTGSGTSDTTTTTGATVTTQDGATTNTSTNNGSNTSSTTTTGSNSASNASSSTTTNTGSSRSSTSNSSNSTNSSATNSSNSSISVNQVLSTAPIESRSQTDDEGYRATAGVNYDGQGNYQNFNVPVSDVGVLQSVIRTYFFLNDVLVTGDPNNPEIDAIVNINVDVFGSIRSRFDAVVYNKESLIKL